MRFQVEQGALVQVLQKVLTITEKKSSMPILSNVMIQTSDGETGVLDFSVTDLELSMWTQIESAVESPGSTTVSARKLLEIVRELPQKTIAVESHPNHRLTVEAGRSRFQLPTIPASDFPYLKFHEGSHFQPFDATLLRKCFEKTLYCIPPDDDPFSVSGLFLHPAGSERIRFVASDGHRLVYFEVLESSLRGIEVGKGIIIPRKGVVEIIRTLEREGEVFLGMEENCLTIKATRTILSVQLLEGGFPEYELIIPAERPFQFTVEREPLYHALKRVAVLTDQKYRYVRFTVTNGSLELDGGNPELGNANDSIDIDYSGEVFSVAFNIRYVLDALQVMESAQISFQWVDEYHGGVFLGPEDPEYFSLVMPMVI